MSGNPTTTPPSNVVPMPTNWPGPMFMPKSWPQPPSCFSELASLNACYDSIQMMEQILSKVITDLVTNNTAVQTAIVEAIAKSGSNVPLIGVTNGTDATPGQVGEWFFFTVNGSITGTAAQIAMQSVTLQPGDWDIWASLDASVFVTSMQFNVTSPLPAGMSDNMFSIIAQPTGVTEAVVVESNSSRLLCSVPTLVPFQLEFNTTGAGSAGTYGFTVKARRRR